MPFRELVETLIPPGAFRDAVEQLLRLKQGGEELSWGPSIPALNDWIKAELMRLAEGPALTPTPHPGPEPLNALFRAWLMDAAGCDSSASGRMTSPLFRACRWQ